MKSLLVFIPKRLQQHKPGYLYGKIIYDTASELKKFYVIGVEEHRTDSVGSNKHVTDTIGYYTNTLDTHHDIDRKYSDWINVRWCPHGPSKSTDYNYNLSTVVVNGRKILASSYHTLIIIYDQLVLKESELFVSKAAHGDHFYELSKILQDEQVKNKIDEKSRLCYLKETLLTYHMLLYLYPIIFLTKLTKGLLPLLKYSSLGLHIHGWSENMKWMLTTVIRSKKFSLKTGNHMVATIIDVILGVLALRLLLHMIGDTPPSHILLSNAEKVVDCLKNLIHWLMGAPAGLKLNYPFNNMLGKFFLYHIQLWWTFLIFIRPVMDFAFKVLLLFGKLGITFQISIAADLLALVSFHTYCIYVYAARLFNIQLNGLTALFRLFLGKKKNPLRERIDSCQYQPDQLFIGTLLFTILLFLMPTTWVYYTVFTMLRLLLIGFDGFLTRLKFHLQVIPVYTFIKWLFRSYSTRSVVDISLYSCDTSNLTTLIMSLAVAPWPETWKQCIPDTVTCHPSIEWNVIFKNIVWGQLLYPL